MLSVVILNVVVPKTIYHYVVCHYAKCLYANYHGPVNLLKRFKEFADVPTIRLRISGLLEGVPQGTHTFFEAPLKTFFA
jgi:hypothetical protein